MPGDPGQDLSGESALKHPVYMGNGALNVKTPCRTRPFDLAIRRPL